MCPLVPPGVRTGSGCVVRIACSKPLGQRVFGRWECDPCLSTHVCRSGGPSQPGREENCSAGGGGGDTEAHFPNPPGRGCPTCRAAGGGGVNPTSMARNDTHVALIILTTQMWGGKLLVEKLFRTKILCSCAFGANIHSYTKQRARHGTPFLQPPPLLRRASMSSPPPPPAEQFSGCPGMLHTTSFPRPGRLEAARQPI